MVIMFTNDDCTVDGVEEVLAMVVVMVRRVVKEMFTNLEPGSCDLDRLTGFAILSLRKPPVPLTLEADLASPVPVPILTIDTPSSTNVSSRFELLLDAVALSWRFVG